MPAAVNEVMHSEEEEGPTIVDKMRSAVYKMFFHPDNPISTPKGFEKLLASLPDNTKVLDVGCGDCLYYTEPSICQLIKDKQLVIKGVDIDAGAVAIGNTRVLEAGLEDYVHCEAKDLLLITETYDVVLFMESFPVIPRAPMKTYTAHALTLAPKLLMYHNLVDDEDPAKADKYASLSLQRWLKPKIKHFSLVDFGELTSTTEMKKFLKDAVPDAACSMKVLLSATAAEAMRFPKIFNVGPMASQCDQYVVEIIRN
eukprot:gene18429-19634_t